MGDDELPRYPLGRRARVLVVSAIVLVALIAAGAYWRVHYGIWPGARYPSALRYCGRTYDADHPAVTRSASASLARETARPAGYSGSTMYPAFVFTAPLAHSYRVYAGQPRNVHVGDTPTCTVELYLRTSANRYRGYHLAGSVG